MGCTCCGWPVIALRFKRSDRGLCSQCLTWLRGRGVDMPERVKALGRDRVLEEAS